MADLTDVLPHFDLTPWRHLTFSLKKKGILTAELISLDPVEIARTCPLPLKEVLRMIKAVTAALKADLHLESASAPLPAESVEDEDNPPKKETRLDLHGLVQNDPLFVKTLDKHIDECLCGGLPTGRISEIVGESAVGKTQFVLGLLLSAQLPPPQGLGKCVAYLSTEASLNTTRLLQMIDSHPTYQSLDEHDRPSLDRILTIDIHDLEAQEHIVQFQLPKTVRRFDVGLIVIDSIAANFRAEFNGSSKKVLAGRAIALTRLGSILRKIAHDHNVAIVVTNQVADRFDDARTTADKFRMSSPFPSSLHASQSQPPSTQAPPPYPHSTAQAKRNEIMSLDFQQRFFTGWGDNPNNPFEPQKNPALGLTWANQIDARIALKLDHTFTHSASDTGNLWSDVKRKRYLSLVFAPWAPPTMTSIQYTLEMQGPVSVPPRISSRRVHPDEISPDKDKRTKSQGNESYEFLDPKYWEGDDDEFP